MYNFDDKHYFQHIFYLRNTITSNLASRFELGVRVQFYIIVGKIMIGMSITFLFLEGVPVDPSPFYLHSVHEIVRAASSLLLLL